jgi:hypothetical protein
LHKWSAGYRIEKEDNVWRNILKTHLSLSSRGNFPACPSRIHGSALTAEKKPHGLMSMGLCFKPLPAGSEKKFLLFCSGPEAIFY